MQFTSKLLNAGVSLFIIATSSAGFASEPRTLGTQEPSSSYYRITDPSLATTTLQQGWESPQEVLLQFTKKVTIQLLNFIHFEEPMLAPATRYERRTHFGRWINDPDDETCQNTRAKVLVRDSLEPVKFRNDKQCIVASGNWPDQYTGQNILDAKQVQVDHFVPLKHAWMTGAHQWTFKERCLYANFLGNKYHLLPVDARENMSKGDSGPDRYIPPNETITCSYVKTWLKIKLAWNLVIPDHEAEAIFNIVKNNHCDTDSFVMDKEELALIRQFMQENLDYCVKNRRQ